MHSGVRHIKDHRRIDQSSSLFGNYHERAGDHVLVSESGDVMLAALSAYSTVFMAGLSGSVGFMGWVYSQKLQVHG